MLPLLAEEACPPLEELLDWLELSEPPVGMRRVCPMRINAFGLRWLASMMAETLESCRSAGAETVSPARPVYSTEEWGARSVTAAAGAAGPPCSGAGASRTGAGACGAGARPCAGAAIAGAAPAPKPTAVAAPMAPMVLSVVVRRWIVGAYRRSERDMHFPLGMVSDAGRRSNVDHTGVLNVNGVVLVVYVVIGTGV